MSALSTPRSTPTQSATAAPLTVTPKVAASDAYKPSSSSSGGQAGDKAGPLGVEGAGVSSPAELMTFVDTMLAQLEDKFSESSTEVLERMTTMSTRIDSLEMAIAEIISGEILAPNPPPPNGA